MKDQTILAHKSKERKDGWEAFALHLDAYLIMKWTFCGLFVADKGRQIMIMMFDEIGNKQSNKKKQNIELFTLKILLFRKKSWR